MIEPRNTALVLAAHGDRGGFDRNAVLRRHASSLQERDLFKTVSYGVLNGEPALADALRGADKANADRMLIYPFFMSGGYFVQKILPERLREAGLATRARILEPLGLDPALPGLLLSRSLSTARDAGLDPAHTRLLIAGHGSKSGRASAEATEAVASAVRSKAEFAKVASAFLEEPPFIAEALRAEPEPAVVAGFFFGEGMHGHDDIPQAIEEAAVRCVYTRSVGNDPAIPALVEAAVRRALSHGSA